MMGNVIENPFYIHNSAPATKSEAGSINNLPETFHGSEVSRTKLVSVAGSAQARVPVDPE